LQLRIVRVTGQQLFMKLGGTLQQALTQRAQIVFFQSAVTADANEVTIDGVHGHPQIRAGLD
jgi:hypothetical protein